MDSKKLVIIHYVNQFFGQEGGEDKADMHFLIKEGPVGPGAALQNMLREHGEIRATLMCGDNYFAENLEKASEEGVKLMAPYKPDLFFAGPAFAAGRYGMACGALCKSVQEKLNIPALTGMHDENPGVDLFRKDIYICKTGTSALKMVEDLTRMAHLALKLISTRQGERLVSREPIGRPSEDAYFPRGVIKNEYTEKTAAQRSIDMLLAKMHGRPFQSEVTLPQFDYVPPPPPLEDMASCEIALISDGGLVPKGNPHKLTGRANLVWAVYEIDRLFPEVSSSEYEIAHTGYFPVDVLANPHRLVPVDVMRDLEREGIIGKLHPFFYSTSGNATVEKRCREMGEEIGKQLKASGVDAAILTST